MFLLTFAKNTEKLKQNQETLIKQWTKHASQNIIKNIRNKENIENFLLGEFFKLFLFLFSDEK